MVFSAVSACAVRQFCSTDFQLNTGLQRDAHILDITQPSQLEQLVLVGGLLELAEVISRPHYMQGPGPQVVEEEAYARMRYRRVCAWFSANFITVINGKWVHPSYVFKTSLARLAAALTLYKRRRPNRDSKVKNGTAPELDAKIRRHFIRDWPELNKPYDAYLLEGKVVSFTWDGPPFTVHRRDSAKVEALVAIGLTELAFPGSLAHSLRKPRYPPIEPPGSDVEEEDGGEADGGEDGEEEDEEDDGMEVDSEPTTAPKPKSSHTRSSSGSEGEGS
jgi:hypothetical protein